MKRLGSALSGAGLPFAPGLYQEVALGLIIYLFGMRLFSPR